MHIKKLLETFSFKSIQEFARILRLVLKEGFTSAEFIDFAKKEKEGVLKAVEMSYEQDAGKNVKLVGKVKSKKVQPKEKPVKNTYIIPGELEKMKGVVCSNCMSEVFITATCCSNLLKSQGFLRKGLCENCGAEFGIR